MNVAFWLRGSYNGHVRLVNFITNDRIGVFILKKLLCTLLVLTAGGGVVGCCTLANAEKDGTVVLHPSKCSDTDCGFVNYETDPVKHNKEAGKFGIEDAEEKKLQPGKPWWKFGFISDETKILLSEIGLAIATSFVFGWSIMGVSIVWCLMNGQFI